MSEHCASRAGDPLVHTHVVMVNRVQGPGGRWTALDGQRLHAHAKTAGFAYQAALRSELCERLQLSWTEVTKGTAEVVGVAPEVLREFSTRRQEIERLMRERGECCGDRRAGHKQGQGLRRHDRRAARAVAQGRR